MIAACPKCGARYRIEEGRLGPQGARLRCARCEAVFRIRAPRADGRAEAPAAPRPLLLLADASRETSRVTARALSALGLEVLLAHDGVEALLEVERRRPRAVVLDAALSGPQICELMKRNQGFRSIPVVLVGARPQGVAFAEGYGPDAELERNDLPENLIAVLRRLGLEIAPAPTHATAAGPPARTSLPGARGGVGPPPAASPPARGEPRVVSPASGRRGSEPARSEAQPSVVHAGLDPAELAKAQRLARIVVSDIVLYNAAKFDAAVRVGNVLEAMRDEIAEGQSLFRQRIEARVRESADFLGQELLRVAAARRAR